MQSTRSVSAYVLLVAASVALALGGASMAAAAPTADSGPSGNRGWHTPAGQTLPASSVGDD